MSDEMLNEIYNEFLILYILYNQFSTFFIEISFNLFMGITQLHLLSFIQPNSINFPSLCFNFNQLSP